MSKYHYLLDPGHGGIINGIYQTKGKRSPKWDDIDQVFEGEFNRDIVKRMMVLLKELNYRVTNLVNTEKDMKLSSRVNKANKLQKKTHDCIYISVHSNAASTPQARGWEVHTSKGETRSDKYATIAYEEMQKMFPDAKFRPGCYIDGDVDRENQFYVLVKTWMPSFLTENWFMTNKEDCIEFLNNDEARQNIAQAHVNAIKRIEKEY